MSYNEKTMNERIKELAGQAGVVYDRDPGTHGPEVYFDRQEDFKKFVELIVKECATVGNRAENNDNEFRCMYDVITEQFGIK